MLNNSSNNNEGSRVSGEPDLDAVIVGAGFAGMYQLYKLRELGYRVHTFEAGSDVGGTWYWNRYPGARVDIESEHYSYSFDKQLQEDWDWNERYSAQPELLAYASHVAERFDLRQNITFETVVTDLEWSENENAWIVFTDTGQRFTARFVILATGCLSVPQKPRFAGMQDYEGTILHTSDWPREDFDLSGKRVAVVGTGSSGVQTVTAIAPEVESLTVFQRTPNYIIPAHNRALNEADRYRIKSSYDNIRAADKASPLGYHVEEPTHNYSELTPEQRRAELDKRWTYGGLSFTRVFPDTMRNSETNGAVSEYVKEKILRRVRNPEVAEKLLPKTFPIGAKRLCVDTGYFEVFNQENVHLVDINEEPIKEFTQSGIHAGAKEYEFDVIVMATGFDAMTGAIERIRIHNDVGETLKSKWAEGARTYLGLMTHGFPNLFMITGPQSPSVLTNMMTSIEFHVEFITRILESMKRGSQTRVEPRKDAEDNWVSVTDDLASRTLFKNAASWYMGANIPGKPRRFLPFVGGSNIYIDYCESVAFCGYHGFEFNAEDGAGKRERLALESAF